MKIILQLFTYRDVEITFKKGILITLASKNIIVPYPLQI